MKTDVILVTTPGNVDTLLTTRRDVGEPGDGEVRIAQTAIGLNFIDIYHRSGLYPVTLPFIPGLEAAGVVEAVGPGVNDFAAGDRVAYGAGPLGAYCRHRVIAADALVKLPSAVTDEAAAALMLKGMTVAFLIHETYAVSRGDTVLFHAAAGGVGLIACQWLKALGATVIGTAGGAEKAAIARDHGCTHVIDYKREKIEDRVADITGGKGVRVAYDSVGRATFEASLNCLAPKGLMVSFGNATGPVDPIAPSLLAEKGSLFLTRPSLMHYAANPADRRRLAALVLDAVANGHIQPSIHQRFALRDSVAAHRALEGRQTTGQTILLPGDASA